MISFDYCFTTVQGEPDEKQYATALYVADSETKAVLCLPVAAKVACHSDRRQRSC